MSRPRLESQSSIVDDLLFEIYDRWHDSRLDSFDSDTFTECSSTSEFMHGRRSSFCQGITVGGHPINNYLHRGILEEQTVGQLHSLVNEMKRGISQMSARLVKQLKRRERRIAKLKTNCDIITAIIQASSPKRRIDTKMRFTVEPLPGDSAFEQWKDAMKAVARLPLGIPDEFRKKVWLFLADNYIKEIKIDWEKTVKFAFNEKSNPDDNKLGLQIVKDLHRTGCSGFSGENNEEERASLKRILLAYARWNKAVGYCQGFNVIAALLLDIMDRKEDDAFKVMIYLIDCVLPPSYFANNLRALSVDMAVFRDLLKIFPKLSKHLDYLQHAQDQASGGCYEPPLTNVFTMQWFLTLFATCLPKSTVLRVWDAIMLEGSEILLRTALTIWGKLSSRILTVNSADEFYTLMGDLTQEMMQGNILDPDTMIKHVYTLAPFPFPQLSELREKYTYNIRPFTPNGSSKKASWIDGTVLPSDEDDLDDDDIEAITCFTGFIPTATSGMRSKGLEGDQRAGSVPDISSLGPGAYGQGTVDSLGLAGVPAYMERMSTDIGALKKQYARLKQRQRQAHIILSSATAKQYAAKTKPIVPKIETPTAVNHLFLAKQGLHGKNRCITAGPRIANMYPVTRPAHVEQRPRSVQPITPHVVGDTKCKWIQKQRKESEKGSKISKGSSSPTKVEAETHIGKEVETNNNICMTEETCDLKASVNEGGRINDNSVVSCKTDDENSLNDSGLGTSLHSSSTLDATDQDIKQVDNTSQDGKNNNAIHDNTQLKKSENTLDNVVLQSDRESERTMNDNVEYDTKSETMTGLQVMHIQETDLKANRVSVGTSREIQDSTHEAGIEGQTDHVMVSDKYDSHTDVIKHNLLSENGATSDGKNHESADEADSGALNEQSVRDLSQNMDNKDAQKNVDASDVEEFNSKTEEVSRDKCDSQLPTETECDNFSSISVLDENCHEPEVNADGNVNNNCVSVEKHDLQVEVSQQTSGNVDSGKDSKVKSLKPVKSILKNSKERVGSPQTKSVDMYYCSKKSLAAKSTSFDDHLHTYRHQKKSFNPFPVKHVNTNRAKTGIKLGLYKQSTLDEFERNLRKPVWGK